jgi:predicted negative regulator of RcsB-dependent stress response
MDIYASDEEKAEAIKQWWRDNGVSVVTGVVLGIAVIFGGRYWLSHQDAQNAEASAVYFQAVEASKTDTQVLTAATDELMSAYPSSAYSVFGALQSADTAAKAGDYEKAGSYLHWVLDNAKLSAHQELARYRLAKLTFEQGNAEAALQLLTASDSAAFESLIAELEGDIQMAQGDAQAAQQAYEKAMTAAEPNDSRQGLLQIKLDDVATPNES